MKIKIRMKYGNFWRITALAVFMFSVLSFISASFFYEGNIGLAILGLVFTIMVLGIWTRLFSYGIYINDKRILLIEDTGTKIISYDNVRKINVRFNENSIGIIIKQKGREDYIGGWEKIYTKPSLILLTPRLKLDDKFVDESIAALLQCPKVEVQNFFKYSKSAKWRRQCQKEKK